MCRAPARGRGPVHSPSAGKQPRQKQQLRSGRRPAHQQRAQESLARGDRVPGILAVDGRARRGAVSTAALPAERGVRRVGGIPGRGILPVLPPPPLAACGPGRVVPGPRQRDALLGVLRRASGRRQRGPGSPPRFPSQPPLLCLVDGQVDGKQAVGDESQHGGVCTRRLDVLHHKAGQHPDARHRQDERQAQAGLAAERGRVGPELGHVAGRRASPRTAALGYPRSPAFVPTWQRKLWCASYMHVMTCAGHRRSIPRPRQTGALRGCAGKCHSRSSFKGTDATGDRWRRMLVQEEVPRYGPPKTGYILPAAPSMRGPCRAAAMPP